MAIVSTSTKVFAPQVTSVQPAFIYDNTKEEGKVNIYFSISVYNNINDIVGIAYSIIDPNLAATWGRNSMLKTQEYALVLKDNFKQDENNEYYFEINFNSIDFKTLTINQFYQVQLYFIDSEENFSDPSQVTLIRPINEVNITFDLPEAGEDGVHSFYYLDKIIGQTNDEIETLDSYWLQTEPASGIYWNSKVFQVNGIHFDFDVPIDVLVENNIVELKFYYTTTHGYKGEETLKLKLLQPIRGAGAGYPVIEDVFSIPAIGGVVLLINNYNNIDNIVIQKSRFSMFNPGQACWENVNLHKGMLDDTSFFYDFNVESGQSYQYRVIEQNESHQYCINTSSLAVANIVCDFYDILLANSEYMFPIRFNPSISNLKYVVQESITNALGGKYPIIRKNGDTKYRQFTLTGSLYFDIDGRKFSGEAEESIFLLPNDLQDFVSFLEYDWGFYIRCDLSSEVGLLLSLIMDVLVKHSYLGKYFTSLPKLESAIRNTAIDFLYDSKPKLIRTREEGNMIVNFSNISLTPNKQLGGRIYDFSATVTEICEYNEKNLQKYQLNNFYYPLATIIQEQERIPCTSSNGSPVLNRWNDSLKRD